MASELAGRSQEIAVQAKYGQEIAVNWISVKWLNFVGFLGVLVCLCAPRLRAIGCLRPYKGVGIDEKVGQNVDLNLEFTNEKGYQEPLKDFFKPGRPVLLNLVYYNCPMLCNLLLNGQVDVLRKITVDAGRSV